MLDQISGTPCTNCQEVPVNRDLFCSRECRDQYEGTGAYAETEPAGALFTRTELVEGEALRQWKGAQIPGQVDIWDACAEVAAEQTDEAPVVWPEPEGVLFDAEQMRGQLVIA